MRKVIGGKTYDTRTAKLIGVKYEGSFGQPNGFEEQLFATKNKQYFLYGMGGQESKYTKPEIVVLTEKEAGNWKKENLK